MKEISAGYQEGAEVLITTVKAAKELGVKTLTAFSFSTENWNRPPQEIDILLTVISDYLKKCQMLMVDMGVRLHVIGNIEKMPQRLIDVIEESKTVTGHCSDFDLVLAMNYGSRDEIKRAIAKIALEYAKGNISLDDLKENTIGKYLDTAPWPDPDLIIRTSGERRISNFLLWQISYAELYTEEVNWPSFSPKHLLNAILEYQKRERRRGGG